MDAWLDGYTPNYSTVVWMGYPNREVPMTSVHGEPQQGGRLPADIWHAYMSAVTAGKPCVRFPSSSESLAYKPFFGKYSSTGRTESFGEGGSEAEEPRSRRGSGRSRGGTGGARPGAGTGNRGQGRGRAGPRQAPAAPRVQPPAPAQPPLGRTGGASP